MKTVLCLIALFLPSLAFSQCSNGSCAASPGSSSSRFIRFQLAPQYQSIAPVSQYTIQSTHADGWCESTIWNDSKDLYVNGQLVGSLHNDGKRWCPAGCDVPVLLESLGKKKAMTMPDSKKTSSCTPCGCGCVKTGSCLCMNCEKHTADPASPDYIPPKSKK